MKWTVALLVVLGVIAAFCAMLLVNTLRLQGTGTATRGQTDVVLVTRSLPAMTVLTADAVNMDSAEGRDIPQGAYANSTQVIGKILAVPVVEGQVLTKSCLVSEGSGAQLMSSIPAGMRAVSIKLSRQSVSGGLLYPGCVVDVLASFRLSGRGQGNGEAVSTTLLHGVQVLAVAGQSVVSNSDSEAKEKEKRSSESREITVTLLVEPEQAERLQLATGMGTVSLAMRNPLDKTPVDDDTTVLSRGQLSKLDELLGASAKTSVESSEPAPIRQSPPPQWGVTVIRGNQVEEQEVSVRQN